jgi:hypothetical protein
VPHPAPSPAGAANINCLIAAFNATRDIPGELAECGVYRGTTLIPLALYAMQQGVAKHCHGFDSFEGFPENILKDVNLGEAYIDCKRPAGMNETSYELVFAKLRLFGLSNVQLHKGFFENTLPPFAALSFSFVHLDCDTYDSYKECLAFFYPRMPRGGIIMLDEYYDPPWPGCNQAVDEFLSTRPERCQAIIRDNHVKYYILGQ